GAARCAWVSIKASHAAKTLAVRRGRQGRSEMMSTRFLLLRSQGENTNVGEVPVTLGVIQAVADHEFVGDRETHIVGADFRKTPFRLVQQDRHTQAARLA